MTAEELTEAQVRLLCRLGPRIIDDNGNILPRAEWHYRWTRSDKHPSVPVRLNRADQQTADSISDEQIDAYIQWELAKARTAVNALRVPESQR